MKPSSEISSEPLVGQEHRIQLLLFLDKRSASQEQYQQVKDFLDEHPLQSAVNLQAVDVEEQPYMAEYFKLIATPALVKIHPEPKRVLAGNNLVHQLQDVWNLWQEELTLLQAEAEMSEATRFSLSQALQTMQMSEELFKLQQDNENLRAQMQFKDRIIAMLAHDLRNPLTATSIAFETIENYLLHPDQAPAVLTPEKLSRLAHHARSQMQMIDRMITNLLEASKGENTALSIRPRPLNIGQLCTDVIADMTAKIAAKGLILKTDIPPDLPLVHADEDLIRQVLINLLDNAIKYTPTGGKIRASILHRTTQQVQATICDTGLGIPDEKQRSIFEETYRLERDEAQEGYGIGLALCQRIIRAHYGRIWVDSTSGAGSCFHFTLPVHSY